MDAGPRRVFNCGKWTEIKLFTAEIDWEQEKCPPWQQELVETGTEAMNCGDYTLAEESFLQILDKDPDCCSAAYNMCVIWLQRDGAEGKRRARAKLEEIHSRFADYLFAPIALSQIASLAADRPN